MGILLHFLTNVFEISSLSMAFDMGLCGSAAKEPPCNVGDLGSIPGLERFP